MRPVTCWPAVLVSHLFYPLTLTQEEHCLLLYGSTFGIESNRDKYELPRDIISHRYCTRISIALYCRAQHGLPHWPGPTVHQCRGGQEVWGAGLEWGHWPGDRALIGLTPPGQAYWASHHGVLVYSPDQARVLATLPGHTGQVTLRPPPTPAPAR